MGWVRQSRPEGTARANQCLTPRKNGAGSNLADMGRCAVRDRRDRAAANSEAGLQRRWGGHGEGLRRSRGEAAGVQLGA
jgi:hypothetical protein